MARNPWTEEEIIFLKKYGTKYNRAQLAEMLGTHSATAVQSKCGDLHIHMANPCGKMYSFSDVEKEMEKRGYILLSKENEYKNAASKMRYICPKHKQYGEQTTTLGHLQSGRGCMYCGRERTVASEWQTDLTKYETSAKKMCKDRNFTFVSMDRDKQKNICINFICNEHKAVGVQQMRYYNMRRSNIVGCKYCLDKTKFKFSKGEKKIEDYLQANNISYIKQYCFDDCRDKCVLPFDFYCIDINTIIEYDGEHHYRPIQFNGISEEAAEKDHNDIVKHDKIKNKYCENHGIKIIRIPYWDRPNIEKILKEQLIA